jgi:hypothetical protein
MTTMRAAVLDAHAMMEDGRATGKLVVTTN